MNPNPAGPSPTQVDAATLRGHVEQLAATPRHRKSTPRSVDTARAYVSDQLTQAGWTVREHDFAVPTSIGLHDHSGPISWPPLAFYRGLTGRNLLATRPGQHETGVLLLAHLDTIAVSPGANDNASAVAVLLEVARLLDAAATKRPVSIAIVDLEEIGQAGAAALARHLDPLPEAVICLDCVGYFNDEPGSQKLPLPIGLAFPTVRRAMRDNKSRADFLLAVHRRNSRHIADQWTAAAHAVGIRTITIADRRWAGRGQHITRWFNVIGSQFDRSDHAPFWRRQVPALFITDTGPLRSSHYHRSTDTPDTLDYPRLAQLTSALANLLLRADGDLAQSDPKPDREHSEF